MQLSLFAGRNSVVARAVEDLAKADERGRGSVYTRREVVDFILDLIGYTSEQRLWEMRILEPAFGNGDFLIPIIDRLLDSCRIHGVSSEQMVLALRESIIGVELHGETFINVAGVVKTRLVRVGIPDDDAELIVNKWLVNDDYLLYSVRRTVDFVVGNPPYIRLELVPDALRKEYLKTFSTMTDRADIYVAFFEKSLGLLRPHGKLGFICSDRWLKNTYGKRLREFVSSSFEL